MRQSDRLHASPGNIWQRRAASARSPLAVAKMCCARAMRTSPLHTALAGLRHATIANLASLQVALAAAAGLRAESQHVRRARASCRVSWARSRTQARSQLEHATCASNLTPGELLSVCLAMVRNVASR